MFSTSEWAPRHPKYIPILRGINYPKNWTLVEKRSLSIGREGGGAGGGFLSLTQLSTKMDKGNTWMAWYGLDYLGEGGETPTTNNHEDN